MLPTLKLGSLITVDLHAFRATKPAVGDIVAFHPPRAAELAVCADPREGFGSRQPCGVLSPRESRETFVERVVGLPGDRISIVRGHVVRNGVREHDPYIYDDCAHDQACNFPISVVIPRGDYFMMGDNRGAANDSRFWGPVRGTWLIGKVIGFGSG
jgi:signal peptidase I